MPEPRRTASPDISIRIGNIDIGPWFTKLEWYSFVNGGYVVKVSVEDPLHNIMKDIATKFYLEKGRRRPTLLQFQIKWAGGEKTEKRIAYISDLYNDSSVSTSNMTFYAIDPPSWWLNAGEASGRAFKGKISDVIKQVISEATGDEAPPGIEIDIGETDDDPNNIWWMMRQDPKTFIRSLVSDWASAVTKQDTHWLIASVDRKIVIKEQAEKEHVHLGNFTFNTELPGAGDILGVEMMANNIITAFQNSLLTAGISAVSGEVFDKVTDRADKNVVFVNDENTGAKVNTNFGPKRGFAKPEQKPWATHITSIPEFSGGEIGLPYKRYIDGRARTLFLNMLNMVMRIKVSLSGLPRLDSSELLGVSTINIQWEDVDHDFYFLSGDWLVYGFHHVVARTDWVTNLFCSRLDYNANARKVGPGAG